MIAIVNVDPNPRSIGPDLYEIRLNRQLLATFVHSREHDLVTLFEKVATTGQVLCSHDPPGAGVSRTGENQP